MAKTDTMQRETARQDIGRKESVRREPRQERALHKVSLILEATMQLLERGDIGSLTTDAIAARAGVSIGTLYQYFDNKQGILDALSQREIDAMQARVMKALRSPDDDGDGSPGHRIRRVVRAVLSAYGGRRRVHRALLEYALARGPGTRLHPLYSGIVQLLITGEVGRAPHSPGDAFVLTHAIGGVVRGIVSQHPVPVPRDEIEDSLVRLIERFEQTREKEPREKEPRQKETRQAPL